jgi:uncharacterized protein
MSGETDLNSLLQNMKPELNPGEYVFCSIAADNLPAHTDPVGWFREREGATLIFPRHQADALGLPSVSASM